MTTTAVDPLPQRIKTLYSLVATDPAKVLAELPELYTSDLHFINPVVDLRGLDAFTAQWKKAFSTYKLFEIVDIEVVGDEQHFSMTYTMNIRFAFGPTFRMSLATDFRGRDGKVYYTCDYFDVVGSVLEPFPLLSCLYKKIFGLLVA